VGGEDTGGERGPGGSAASRAGAGSRLNESLEEIFRLDESNSLELTRAEWEARDIYRRFTEFVLTPLRPLL